MGITLLLICGVFLAPLLIAAFISSAQNAREQQRLARMYKERYKRLTNHG
jgi:hypothetical protein